MEMAPNHNGFCGLVIVDRKEHDSVWVMVD